MFLECGQERGADAIENISYVLGRIQIREQIPIFMVAYAEKFPMTG